MAFTGIPEAISTAILGITDNKYLILLLVNVVLLFVGMFTDVGPAILIFTPIFLPIVMNVVWIQFILVYLSDYELVCWSNYTTCWNGIIC